MSAFADQLGFGAGVLVATAIGGATPIRFGVLQECSPDFKTDAKPLFGQKRYPIALAAGKTTPKITAKYAGFRGRLLFDLFFNSTDTSTSLTTGSRIRFADNELVTGVAGAATVANAASFVADAGVYVKWSGRPLVGFDPTVPGATGDYTAAAGAYTFVSPFTAADQNPTTGLVDVYVSYTWTDATSGTRMTFGNPLMGTQPIFSAVVNMAYDGRSALWTFPRCMATNLKFTTKLDDWEMADFEFEIAQDIGGSIGEIDTDL